LHLKLLSGSFVGDELSFLCEFGDPEVGDIASGCVVTFALPG
jgi:hypothetical protein